MIVENTVFSSEKTLQFNFHFQSLAFFTSSDERKKNSITPTKLVCVMVRGFFLKIILIKIIIF